MLSVMKRKPRAVPHASAIQEELERAFDLSPEKISFAELARRSGLACTGDSMRRKLRGTQTFLTEEAEAVARYLKVSVTITRPRRAA